jgi:hypothetical protein
MASKADFDRMEPLVCPGPTRPAFDDSLRFAHPINESPQKKTRMVTRSELRKVLLDGIGRHDETESRKLGNFLTRFKGRSVPRPCPATAVWRLSSPAAEADSSRDNKVAGPPSSVALQA